MVAGQYELPKNEWSYVNAVFDGNQGEIKLYLNGSEIASAAVPRGSRLAEAADTDLLIGKNNHSSLLAEVFSLHMFSGIIDELKIYNRALSAEEVVLLIGMCWIPFMKVSYHN